MRVLCPEELEKTASGDMMEFLNKNPKEKAKWQARVKAHKAEKRKLRKTAAGAAETYIPWYGVTAGGVGGGALGAHLAPGRYKHLGTMGGALLGTAAGLHGGEALGRVIDERSKPKGRVKTAAEAKEDESKLKRVLKVMGTSAAGLGIGAGLGAGAGYMAGKRVPTKYLMAAPALLGAGMGVAYPLMKSYERREMDRALKTKSNKA